ncbi:sugar ABC transporter ATP-binding protein [Mesorhizobium sp. IMUNJ 23232]|uniref:sugar ABC transporter ATP-binding protein n=1 Tax=Mesorhizobium sp. IMUNJ 23232 TaxID=3376064 RepID=UPI00378BB7CA
MQASNDQAGIRAEGAHAPAAELLRCRGLVKSFAAVWALRGVDFGIDAGRVRGLVGENGAGKSTLVKIIAGVYPPDAGTFELEGAPMRFSGADDALARRIVTVHQDINLIQTMTVGENLLLNNEPTYGFGVIRRRAMADKVSQLLRLYEIDVDPDAVVSELPNDLKKMVQIVKGVSLDPKILILDEPTSSLTESEVQVALRLIRRLADSGVGVVLISHYLNEIFAVCDDLTVMRDGEVVADGPVSETSLAQVVTAMVGRHVETQRRAVAPRHKEASAPLMRVEALSIPARLDAISFELGHGEVLGITGLAGSGLGELAKAIFGAEASGRLGGRVVLDGAPVPPRDPAASLKAGLALITGDRRREGLLLDFTLKENICLPILSRFTGAAGRLDGAAMTEATTRNITRLHIRAPGPEALASQLSGGNQQKVLFAKWLETRPKVFVMEDPTIGIDVGAKAEIRAIIDEIAAAGVGIVLITTELEELVTLCDRVLVMFRGQLVTELTGAAIRRESILHAAACGEELAVPA